MRTWKDIDITLEKKRDGDIRDFSHVDAVKTSIANILTTLRTTRRMRNEFANNLWSLLFEPIDKITASQIGEILLSAISRWEDRVIIDNLHITPRPDRNYYHIRFRFRLKNSDEIHEMEEVLVRG